MVVVRLIDVMIKSQLLQCFIIKIIVCSQASLHELEPFFFFFDKIINSYFEFLGLYGGGADDLVERHGGGGIPSVNLMEELLGSLIPPRSNMSLLGAGLSSSMLRGDSV